MKSPKVMKNPKFFKVTYASLTVGVYAESKEEAEAKGKERVESDSVINEISDPDPEWSKNWNALKRRDVQFSQSPAAVSLSQFSPG